MNPSLITRAIRRHWYMKDGPAYRELLEHVRAQGDTLLVPQAEIADWWERRQVAALRVRRDAGHLVLECDLDGACVEIDRERVEVLPARVPLTSTQPDRGAPMVYDGRLQSPFFEELIGHLGYRHVQPAPAVDERAPLSAARLAPLVSTIEETARAHQRFPETELEAVREAFGAAHREAGLPELRLWTLPASGGRPARAAVSSRYDVDSAIFNMLMIHDLEESFGLRSTVYLRPFGMFYGRREIRQYLPRARDHEIALHGEFVSTAEERFGDEFTAAVREKEDLEQLSGREVFGVCMHGGELRTNTTPRTREAVERAGYRYETMYRNRYYLPLHLPDGAGGVRRTLSIGQHFADISVAGTPAFADQLRDAFIARYEAARAVGGVFVPVMHPLYFDIPRYLRQPISLLRIAAFAPSFLGRVARMKAGQYYSNEMP